MRTFAIRRPTGGPRRRRRRGLRRRESGGGKTADSCGKATGFRSPRLISWVSSCFWVKSMYRTPLDLRRSCRHVSGVSGLRNVAQRFIVLPKSGVSPQWPALTGWPVRPGVKQATVLSKNPYAICRIHGDPRQRLHCRASRRMLTDPIQGRGFTGIHIGADLSQVRRKGRHIAQHESDVRDREDKNRECQRRRSQPARDIVKILASATPANVASGRCAPISILRWKATGR